MGLLYKSASDVLDVSTESRMVKAVWGTFDNADSVGDVILSGAFNKSITERGVNGKNTIFSLVEHQYSIEKSLGKPIELYQEGNQLIAVTKLVDTTYANDILTLYQEGIINQHSVGMLLPKDKSETKNGFRYIKEAILLEGSATLWGVNTNTPTLSVNKSLFEPTKADHQERFERICKMLRNGNISDDMAILLELEIKSILSTQAEQKPLEPQLSEYGNIIKSFVNQ